jgi:uncharacterized short protein YbdD (DUF466 family)
MICQCFGRSFDISVIARRVRLTADLMVGLPDYDTYVAHIKALHPDTEVMSRDAFFRERQAARYGANGSLRCC